MLSAQLRSPIQKPIGGGQLPLNSKKKKEKGRRETGIWRPRFMPIFCVCLAIDNITKLASIH
jgi:hypothetical protein